MAEPADDERIEGLKADALLRDARITELIDQVEHLQRAMEHRAAIEQAKGVIMATAGCGPDAAFAVLVAQSQSEHRKLWEIAVEIAEAQDRDAR